MRPPIQTLAARQLVFAQQPTDLLLCDPCYLIEQPALWRCFVDQITAPGAPQADAGIAMLPTGGTLLYTSTAYGDGCYTPQLLHTECWGDFAAVDSGMLCLIPVDDAHEFAGPRSTAFRPDLVMVLHAVTGLVSADGNGRLFAPEIGLVLDTAVGVA